MSKLDLKRIVVKPIEDYDERELAQDFVSRYHPLGANKLKGERLVYSVKFEGHWLGVLFFDAAVRRNKLREARIGWSREQRDERIMHVVNNSRFLVLPNCAGIKNLSSRILSLATARLSSDWKSHYGRAILAVETYVDPNHNENKGACYSASGWENLGYSSGFEKSKGERTHSKWYFLKALHKDSYKALSSELPHALITGIKPVSGESNNNKVLDASKLNLKSLQLALSELEDHRSKQGRVYEFLPFLSLCVAAVLSGYTQYREITDWIARLPVSTRVKCGMPADRVPSESRVAKFLAKIDADDFQRILSQWLKETYNFKSKSKVVSLDGKSITATSKLIGEQFKFLNVLANDLGIVIDQLATKGGGHEITAGINFIKNSEDLEDKIILADAIHTTKELSETLQKKTANMSSLSKVIRKL